MRGMSWRQAHLPARPPAHPVRAGHSSTGVISAPSGPGRWVGRPRGAHLLGAWQGPSSWRPAVCPARAGPHRRRETHVWAQRRAWVASVRGRWRWQAGREASSGLSADTPPGRRPHRPHLEAQGGGGALAATAEATLASACLPGSWGRRGPLKAPTGAQMEDSRSGGRGAT